MKADSRVVVKVVLGIATEAEDHDTVAVEAAVMAEDELEEIDVVVAVKIGDQTIVHPKVKPHPQIQRNIPS